MMRAIRPPESKQATTLLVAVRCRPLTPKEQTRSRDILRVVDDKVVVVLDPDSSKEYLDRVQNRSKEKKYVFDVAFGPDCTNKDVYNVTVGSMIDGVLRGLNATVFAYGATGSGKTHTMAGLPEDPGLMVLSLQAIFGLIAKQEHEHDFEVTCSYLEVYNEVIYDLLEKSSGHLELREDPDQGITVAGLKRIQVNSAEKILELLNLGNSRRKTESTNANATSSRSHAVLEIIVKRKQRNQYRSQVLRGKLALVDLAGSERASETNNAGQKLRDGANINRSLLALANCINALGKQQKKGLAYVPYRNSKLTRLLKDGLSGNSRTVMVATVSCADDQYHHTTNTLKYADRAKEIKTHIQMNVGTVDAHVADYQRMIDNLQVEVSQLRRELAEKETQLSARTPEKSSDDELSWLDVLSHDINENVEMRINLQKALFELEDMNLHNRMELQQLDELIARHQDNDSEKMEDLIERRQVVLDNIRDNDEAGAHYRQDIEQNENQRKELQRQIDEAISSNRNKTYLRILSQYRLLGMTNMELQFQMAIRDQIIQDQREALNNMWRLLESSGLNHDQILEIAAQQGIMIEDGILPISGRSHTSGGGNAQPMTPSAVRFSNIIQMPAESSKEFRVSSTGSIREQLEIPISPRTPNPEWRLAADADNNVGQLSVTPKVKNLGRSTPLPDAKPQQNDVVESGKDLSPERFREICKQVLLESGVLGRTDASVETPCTCIRPRPQTAQGNRKLPTPAKHKRKPRSAECRSGQHQVRGMVMVDGNTTGGDAGSEGSETEDSDPCSTSMAARQVPRTPLTSSADSKLDNRMLQRELSRLDNELQDLKRGIERKTSLNGLGRGHISQQQLSSSAEQARLGSSRNSRSKATMEFGPRSAPATADLPYSHRVNGGVGQQPSSLSAVSTPVLQKRHWGRLVDAAAGGGGGGGTGKAGKVFLFSPPEVEGKTMDKAKGLTDRISSASRGRQLWPRNISQWTA